MSRLKGLDLGIPAGAMNYRGAWSSAASYAPNDVALYNGTLIRANKTLGPMSASAPLTGTATTQVSASTTIAAALPSSALVGDVLLMAVAVGNASTVVNTPAGWTLVNSQVSWLYVFSKVAVAGDPGSTVTVTMAASAGATAVVRSYSSQGVDASAKAGSVNGTPPPALAPPSAVATVAGDTQVTFFSEYSSNTNWNPSLAAGATNSLITPTPGNNKGVVIAEDWFSLPSGASAVSGGALTDSSLYQGATQAISVLLKPSAIAVPAPADWDTLVTLPASVLLETVNTVAASGAAVTLPDVAAATMHKVTLTANTTITLPAPGAGKSFTVELVQDATGGRTVAWATPSGTIKWPGGTVPVITATANAVDVISFVCIGGTNWYGFVGGQAFA